MQRKSVLQTLPLPDADEELLLSPDRTSWDPVVDDVLAHCTQEENRQALAEAHVRLETGLLDLGRQLSPARAEVYRVLLRQLRAEGRTPGGDDLPRSGAPSGGLQTLRARIADELHLSRNTASMRLLWLFRKAAGMGIPLETIVADPDLVRVAQPIFRRVAAQLGIGDASQG
jgi:hypothetical protein